MNRLNLALTALLALLLLAHVVLRPNPARPNPSWPLSNMARSRAAESYAANTVLPGGQVLQQPVAGTQAHGRLPFNYAATPEDATRAGRELSSPLPANSATDLARGQQVFGTFCTPCHGATGQGDGMVAKRGFPPPPALTAEHAVGLADGQIFHIMTLGQKNMPGHAAQIEALDRWRCLLFVRQLQADAQRAAAPAAAPAPSASTAQKPAQGAKP